MKNILIYLFLFAIIISCNNNSNSKNPNKSSIINDSLSKNTKNIDQIMGKQRLNNMQNFAFVNKKGFTYKGKGGTVLIFEPNVFDCKEKDTIKISICEFANIPSIVKANLSTLSNDSFLETNGMVYCNAYSNNKEIELKKGKSFTCMFNKPKKDGYKLFEGIEKDGTINWINPVVPIKQKSNNNALKDVKYNELKKEAFYICAYGSENEINDNEIPFKFIDDSTNHVTKCFIDKYNIPYNDLVPFSPDESIILHFILNQSGKLEFKSSDTPLDNKLLNKIIAYFEKMPQMRGYVNNINVKEELPVFFTICPNKLLADRLESDNANMKIINRIKAVEEEKEKQQQIESDKAEKEIIAKNKREFEMLEKNQVIIDKTTKIIFKATKMGWINCDKFYYDTRPKADIIFADLESYSSYNIQIIFTSIRSVFSMNYGDRASNIPVNESLKIIFVGLKENDNSLFFYNKNITTSINENKIDIVAVKIDSTELSKYIEKSIN